MSNIYTHARESGEDAYADAAAFTGGEIGAHQRMSWSAVIGGALTGLVAQLVLSLLGLGIGLSAAPGAASFSIGAAIWLLLCAIVAYGVGGYISARLSGGIARSAAGYQGLVTWALTTVVALFMLTTAVGSIVGGTLSAVTGALGGAGSAVTGAVKSVAPAVTGAVTGSDDPTAAILGQLKSTTNDPANAAAGNDAVAAVRSALSSDPDKRAQATDQAAQALAKAKGIPVDQARGQVEGYERQVDELKAQAKATAAKVGSEAAGAASGAALGASISLILGALAAFFAARFGAIGVGRRLVSAA